MAKGTEVPEEFYFACGLTLLGATCSTSLRLNVGIDCQPRLYTVLLGDSYEVKKGTAMRKMVEFFEPLWSKEGPKVVGGVGSGEGLARTLKDCKRLVLCLCPMNEMSPSLVAGLMPCDSFVSVVDDDKEGGDDDIFPLGFSGGPPVLIGEFEASACVRSD
jgi:hypothetical protein